VWQYLRLGKDKRGSEKCWDTAHKTDEKDEQQVSELRKGRSPVAIDVTLQFWY
jgi:hypothetical protein